MWITQIRALNFIRTPALGTKKMLKTLSRPLIIAHARVMRGLTMLAMFKGDTALPALET